MCSFCPSSTNRAGLYTFVYLFYPLICSTCWLETGEQESLSALSQPSVAVVGVGAEATTAPCGFKARFSTAAAAAAGGGKLEAFASVSEQAPAVAERSHHLAPPLQFKHVPGRITGGNWDTSRAFSSLADAETFCSANPQCNAITFENGTATTATAVQEQVYWFTSLATVDPTAKQWQSYVITPHRPPAPAPPPPPPPPPPPLAEPWAGLCGRLTKAFGATSGVCIEVNGTQWQVVEKVGDGGRGGHVTVLGSGALANAASATWISVDLTFAGSTLQASINGKQLVLDTATIAATKGMFALESGWNKAQFDNFAFKTI